MQWDLEVGARQTVGSSVKEALGQGVGWGSGVREWKITIREHKAKSSGAGRTLKADSVTRHHQAWGSDYTH